MSKVSKEELEAFWRGDKNIYQRMYSQRMQQKADEAKRQGKQVTYIPNDGSATLPEVSVTALRETEEQKQKRLKQDYENLTNNAITVAGFIPGADTFADIADIGNSWRKGDYSGMLWGLAGLGLPVSGKALKSGWNRFKNLPNIRNYKAAREISSDMDKGRRFIELRDKEYLENREWDPTRYLSYSRVGKPETDSETFYHYMNVPFGQPITARSGQVRLQNNAINPVPGHEEQQGRIWWNKGSLPSGNPSILITSKSNLIDERVVDHPEKYSIYHGLYEPTYYTSGPISLKDIQIYEKNPFTGHYDSDKRITYNPTKSIKTPTINFSFDILQDAKDIEDLKEFAKQYGYILPKGIERYSGDMLDKEFKRILTKHNTFGRGVQADNIQNAEKFLTTAHSGSAGAMDGMPSGKTGIYTMNGLSPYGNYQGVVQRQLDFSGPRNTWIIKNDTPYLSSNDASKQITLLKEQYMQKNPYQGQEEYFDNMWKYLEDNNPEVFNSSGQIYKINDTNILKQVGIPGVVIHGGNPGEKVLNAVNIFKPYNLNIGKTSTRGFSHKVYQKGGKL